jgi:hypothetical protein
MEVACMVVREDAAGTGLRARLDTANTHAALVSNTNTHAARTRMGAHEAIS